MFGAKYSRLKFWIISICLLILNIPMAIISNAPGEGIENTNILIILIAIILISLPTIIWINTLANRIRDYGSNPWISLYSLIPFVNIGLALYYGIAKSKNKPENNENVKKDEPSLTKAVYNHSKDIASEIKPAINEYKEKHTYSNISAKEKTTSVSNNINEDEIYEQIMIEIEEDKKVKSTWAKSLAQNDGDRDKAESSYIKSRFVDIKNEIYNLEKIDSQIFCGNCGERLETNSLFCGNCGTKIDS